MRKFLFVISAFLTGILLAGSVPAQDIGDLAQQRFRAEYEKTKQVIERATSVVHQSGTEKGIVLLKLAVDLQVRSRELADNRNFAIAIKLTMEAREKAHAAIMVSQQADENENLVQRQLEKTDNLIFRVQDKITPQMPNMVHRIFDTARENQRRAWEFFRKIQLRPALKMTRQAEKMIKGLIDKFQKEKGNLQRLQTQMHQLEIRIDQVRELVAECGNDEAASSFHNAVEKLKEAARLFDEGKIRRSENAFKMAQKMMRRAENLCGDLGSLERKIDQLRKKLERLTEASAGNDDGNIAKLLKSAKEHIRIAAELCAAGDSKGCAANIKAAQMNLRKAENLLGL